MERHGWTVLVFVATAAATLVTKAMQSPRQPKVIVKKPTEYTEGMEALKQYLFPPERERLLRVDSLYERYFDNCVNDLKLMRAVSKRLDQAMCLSRDLVEIEKELLPALRAAAGSELNQKAGLVATAELMILLRAVLRRKAGGMVMKQTKGR